MIWLVRSLVIFIVCVEQPINIHKRRTVRAGVPVANRPPPLPASSDRCKSVTVWQVCNIVWPAGLLSLYYIVARDCLLSEYTNTQNHTTTP